MIQVEFAPAAIVDLESIADYIAADSPDHAERFVELIRARCLHIAEAPRVGRNRPDLGAGIRMVPFRRYLIPLH